VERRAHGGDEPDPAMAPAGGPGVLPGIGRPGACGSTDGRRNCGGRKAVPGVALIAYNARDPLPDPAAAG
jgi:hypothetical protein